MSRPHPIAIIGPSGVGKTTLVRRWTDLYSSAVEVVSHTSRPPRPGEVNTIDYHFVERAQLAHMIDQEMLIEHAEYGDNLYGLSKVAFDTAPAVPVVVIERHGFDQLCEYFGRQNVVGVLLLPPSWNELKRRLEEGGRDASRLETAQEEMRVDRDFDLILVHDQTMPTIRQLKAGLHRVAKLRGWMS